VFDILQLRTAGFTAMDDQQVIVYGEKQNNFVNV
jgi:hypothetical protein